MSDSTDGLQKQRARLTRLMHLRHLGLDPARGGKGPKAYRADEANTADALEKVLGLRLERSQGTGDWIARDANGAITRVYDGCSPSRSQYFDASFDAWTESLHKHAVTTQGIDVVVIDLRLRGLTLRQMKRVIDAVKALPDAGQAKVLFLVDADIADDLRL